MGFQPRCREDTPTLELLYVSKQCPTPTPFSPAMTRVRAHQERLIHCLAIPRACFKNSFVSGLMPVGTPRGMKIRKKLSTESKELSSNFQGLTAIEPINKGLIAPLAAQGWEPRLSSRG